MQTPTLESSISVEASRGSGTVVCTFGGIRQGIGIPIFEFRRTLERYDADRIFVRDLRQRWYHGGIKEAQMGGLNEYEEVLEKLLAPYNRKVFIGNSMGGFAALYFGSKLGADAIIAFDAQTFIGPIKRFIFRDYRWARQIANLYLSGFFSKNVFDLANYDLSKATILAGAQSRQDIAHAENARKTGAKIVIVDGAKHDLVKRYRDSGKLDALLSKAIDNPA